MAGNPGSFGADVDQRLTVRIPVKAGSHTVSAATILRSHAEKDDLIKPFLRTTVDGLDITGDPSVDRLSIEGRLSRPARATRPPAARSSSAAGRARRKTSCRARGRSSRRWRAGLIARPVNDADMETLLSFYQRGRNNDGSFEAGIESALQLILASPEFLFRFEPDPANLAAGRVYRLGDLALASRLSFFLWSSIPDDELAESGRAGQAEGSRGAGAAGEAHAGRPASPTRWSTTSPSSGCTCAT